MTLAFFATVFLLAGGACSALGIAGKDEATTMSGIVSTSIAVLLIMAPHVFGFVCWAMGVAP